MRTYPLGLVRISLFYDADSRPATAGVALANIQAGIVMTIHDLGWSPSFAHAFESLHLPTCQPARIVRQDRTGFLVRTDRVTLRAVLPGTLLKQQTARPVVGDWVAVEDTGSDQLARIHAILPRKSAFSRKEAGEVTREQVVAANVDTAFLMSGLDGDLNLRRIERYVTQTWSSGTTPVVLLNKADLRPDAESVRMQVESTVPGVPVHLVRAQQGEGLEALEAYLRPGQTVVFLGSSGVGKSTLVNALLSQEVMQTGAVREHDSRGRHTTTRRELFILPGGGVVIDTPGLRELQLWASVETLDTGFTEVEALAATCRFRDCMHEQEPGCAVRAALNDGRLDPDRYRNYVKMRRELKYLERRRQETSDHDERRRGRQGALLVREALKRKGRG